MTEVTDFERELRAALSAVHDAAVEPTGLADRLVEAATSDTSHPHRVDLRRLRRWLPPLATAPAHLRTSRRTIAIVAAAAATTAIAIIVPWAVNSLSERDVPSAEPLSGLRTPLSAPTTLLDVRELGFHVEPVPGFVPEQSWELGPTYQGTSVHWTAGDVGFRVKVYYQGNSPQLRPGKRQAVSVHGVTGTYVEHFPGNGDGHWSAQLVWEYAPDSWAEVFAANDHSPPPQAATRPAVLTIAQAGRPGGGVAVRLPFRVGTVRGPLPPAAAVASVIMQPADFYGTGGWEVTFGGALTLGLFANGTWCDPNAEPYGYGSVQPFTYRGHTGCLRGDVVVLRVGTVDRVIDGSPRGYPVEDLKRMLADLTVAHSDDPATWFDPRTALGG